MQRKPVVTWGVLLTLAGLFLAGCGTPAGPSIEVQDVWARPAMAMMESGEGMGTGMGEGQETGQPMAGTGAVFMRLVNKGGEADRPIHFHG